MANRTVEFITDQYGRAVLQNAASESTMRELLEVFKDLEDNIDDVGGGLASGPIKAAQSGKKALGKVWSGVKKTYRVAENTTKAFVDNLENNKNSVSAWGSAINDNLIRQLPVVGEFLGGLGDILVQSAEVFESWNEKLKEVSKNGATFNNSLIDLKIASVNAWMSLDEYSSLIMTNSEKLAAVGGTVDEGRRIFDKFANQLYMDGSTVREELLHMGMSSTEVSTMFMKYFTLTVRGTDKSRIDYERVTKEFGEYAKFQQLITSLTGRNSEETNSRIKETEDDIAFGMSLAAAGDKNRGKILSTLRLSQELFGDSGRKLVQFSQQNMAELSGEGMAMSTFAPTTKRLIDELMAISKDDTIDQAEYNKRSLEILQKYLPEVPGDIAKIRSLIDQGGANIEGTEILKESLKGLNELIVSFGGLQGMTAEAIAKRIEKARKDQKARETFTTLLNEINQQLQKTYADLFKTLGPAFKELGETLKKAGLDEAVKNFGEDLKKNLKEGWKSIQEFFGLMNSEEGQQMIARKAAILAAMIRNMIRGVAIRSMVGEGYTQRFLEWMTGGNTEEQQNVLRQQYDVQQQLAADAKANPTTIRIFGKDKDGKDIALTTRSDDVRRKIEELRKKGVRISEIVPGAEGRQPGRGQGQGLIYDLAPGTPLRAAIDGELQVIAQGSQTTVHVIDSANGIRAVYENMGPWGDASNENQMPWSLVL